MAKRKFAALLVVSVAAAAITGTARAQDAFAGTDGCAVLAKVIFTEVTANAWYGSDGFLPVSGRPTETRVTVCADTARTVTAAFSSAMATIGSQVYWGYSDNEVGDRCLSGFLHQCYPERYPPGGAAAWRALSRTVEQAMPRGVASDQSVFTAAAMGRAIRTSLAMSSQRY